VDLSQIMFICTANRIENIPGPLRDRMEIIEISSYTKNDKQSIAENYLVPGLLDHYNLTKEQLTFESSAIQEIIDHYTWEAGIRNLKRLLNKIFSKFSYKMAVGELKTENITLEKVQEYLGKPTTSDLTFKADYSVPGVVNGLSVYNQEMGGGDVLPIEVSFPPGKGKIITTGNLKETMEESARVAISYVKANFEKFGINKNFNFNDNDIHIHVPKGGIPKDGPSAGVALTTAIISALTKKRIDKDIGMTGEITLHGQVSAIGGLQEKINAAHRKGLKVVFIPEGNEKDLEDIPSEVRGVQNVLLPTLIPLNLLEKEKKHVAGFSPECFYVEKIEGHTIHSSAEEAKQFTLNILSDYQDYAENALCLGVIVGQKTEGEKFAGALETYTVECLLPDGQCLQFATSHYFGDNFCRLMGVKYQDASNKFQYPFSTSWGTSTRTIGAVAKTHADN
ncbi:3297_t:CDS:2, partial [Ambispora gerdemannii]